MRLFILTLSFAFQVFAAVSPPEMEPTSENLAAIQQQARETADWKIAEQNIYSGQRDKQNAVITEEQQKAFDRANRLQAQTEYAKRKIFAAAAKYDSQFREHNFLFSVFVDWELAGEIIRAIQPTFQGYTIEQARGESYADEDGCDCICCADDPYCLASSDDCASCLTCMVCWLPCCWPWRECNAHGASVAVIRVIKPSPARAIANGGS